MAKLEIKAWEHDAALVAAAATRTALTEGTDGADALAPVSDVTTYDAGGEAVPSALRSAFYATLRALQATRPQWLELDVQAGAGWSTGADGQPRVASRLTALGEVELRGRVSGSSVGPVAGPLPREHRPTVDRFFVVPAAGGALTARVRVDTAGWIYLEAWGTGASSWLDLGAVRFDLG